MCSLVILLLYIYFQFWKRNWRHIGILLPVSILTMYRPLHLILSKQPNFIQIGKPMAELWHHIDFQDGGHGVGNLLPVSRLVTCRTWEGQRLSVYQISPRYFNPRLRYYYFRFLKTNGRHIEILRAIYILMSSSSWKCDSPWVCQISSKSDHQQLWRQGDFQDGGRQPCWICFRVVIHHPWSVNDSLNFVLKFQLDRIYTFGDNVIFVPVFCRLGRKVPIHDQF